MDLGSPPSVDGRVVEAGRVPGEYGINWRTLVKMLAHAEPPGYRRKAKREQPVVGPHLAWIHDVLEHDKQEPMKQRHTAKRIFDRLKFERGYTGGYTMVKEAVRTWKDATKEVFVPLAHPPGDWPVLNPPSLEQPATPE